MTPSPMCRPENTRRTCATACAGPRRTASTCCWSASRPIPGCTTTRRCRTSGRPSAASRSPENVLYLRRSRPCRSSPTRAPAWNRATIPSRRNRFRMSWREQVAQTLAANLVLRRLRPPNLNPEAMEPVRDHPLCERKPGPGGRRAGGDQADPTCLAALSRRRARVQAQARRGLSLSRFLDARNCAKKPAAPNANSTPARRPRSISACAGSPASRGKLAFDGAGELVDCIVVMRRFAESRCLTKWPARAGWRPSTWRRWR